MSMKNANAALSSKPLTYEAYLDEVSTLLVELCDLSEKEAIKLVMRAQDAEYFVPHDLDEQRRLEKHAGEDARYLFEGRHGNTPQNRSV
jgi:hypothetical protein